MDVGRPEQRAQLVLRGEDRSGCAGRHGDVLEHEVTAAWQEPLQECENADAVTHHEVTLVGHPLAQPRGRAVLAGRPGEHHHVRVGWHPGHEVLQVRPLD